MILINKFYTHISCLGFTEVHFVPNTDKSVFSSQRLNPLMLYGEVAAIVVNNRSGYVNCAKHAKFFNREHDDTCANPKGLKFPTVVFKEQI